MKEKLFVFIAEFRVIRKPNIRMAILYWPPIRNNFVYELFLVPNVQYKHKAEFSDLVFSSL